MKKTLAIGVVLLSYVSVSQSVQAAPIFGLGADNNLTFSAVANKTGTANVVAVNDIFYGVVNVQTIASGGTYSWNASNASAPYDSFTGYFAARVTGVTSPIAGFNSYTFGALTSAFGSFNATDVANQTLVKLYTDSTAVNGAAATPYTTGNEATDINHATDGQFWGSLGFREPWCR